MNQHFSNSDLVAFARENGVQHPEQFCAVMSRSYFENSHPSDFRHHELFIEHFYKNERKKCLLRYQGEINDFIFHDYDIPTMLEQIESITWACRDNNVMYRTFANREVGFLLHSIYVDEIIGDRAAEFKIPAFASSKASFFDERGLIKRHLVIDYDDDAQIIEIRCINVAHKTLLTNLWETIELHNLNVDFVEVWRKLHETEKVNSFHVVRIHSADRIEAEELQSLTSDFERYIQQYTIPMSIFDLVGPAMVGPSSSHTAGANRIGQIARNIILAKVEQGETIQSLEIKLIGSFRDTGVGHKTPLALAGGLHGLTADDETMLSHGEPDYLRTNGFVFGASKARFIGFTRGLPEDDLRYAGEKNNNVAEIIFTTDSGTHTITGFSIGAGNVEIRYFDTLLETPITGKRDFYLDGDTIVATQNAAGTLPVIRGIFDHSGPETGYVMRFNTLEELIGYCRREQKRLVDVVIDVESGMYAMTREDIFQQMRTYWKTMEQSVKTGVASRKMSMLGLSGDSGFKLNGYVAGHPLFDNIYGRAVAYATAVNEVNARSGVIVACPTAGSCGILPGVLRAYSELADPSEERILESLLVSGFLGMLLFTDVSMAGADYGCQAEVGSAAAMAAAALCYLEGGDVEQVIAAFTLAIKNSLGLICDPIAGLVEVPCVKRNGVYSSLAISAAMMALSGIKSYVSPDEVMLTMREVGERIHSDYKETAKGGLARTRDGKHVEKMFAGELKKFFSRS